MVQVPDLRHEWTLGIDDARDLFFECSDDHGVGHDEGERMVKLHLLVDAFQVVVAQHDASAGVVGGE